MPSRIRTISSTEVVDPAGEAITILIGVPPPSVPKYTVNLLRFKCVRTVGAAAATFRPRIDNVSGLSAADSINQVFRAASTLSTALYDSTAINAYCQTDTAGKLYLYVTPDVAGDTWAYELIFEILGP